MVGAHSGPSKKYVENVVGSQRKNEEILQKRDGTNCAEYIYGGKSLLRMILLVSQENHMDQGGRKFLKECPPAGTGTKI